MLLNPWTNAVCSYDMLAGALLVAWPCPGVVNLSLTSVASIQICMQGYLFRDYSV